MYRTLINTINLLTDTISLRINKDKLVPLLKFVCNIDVGNGGAAPRVLTEQVVASVNIIDSRSGRYSLIARQATLTEVYHGVILYLQVYSWIKQCTGTRPSFSIAIPIY